MISVQAKSIDYVNMIFRHATDSCFVVGNCMYFAEWLRYLETMFSVALAWCKIFSLSYYHLGEELCRGRRKIISSKRAFHRTLVFSAVLFDQDIIYLDGHLHGGARRSAASGARVLKAVEGSALIDIKNEGADNTTPTIAAPTTSWFCTLKPTLTKLSDALRCLSCNASTIRCSAGLCRNTEISSKTGHQCYLPSIHGTSVKRMAQQ